MECTCKRHDRRVTIEQSVHVGPTEGTPKRRS